MGRRTLLLVAALVVAALGTLLIFAYVRQADDRALKDQEPVEVLVAKTLIRAGTLGSNAEKAGAFRLQRIPRSATIEGVLSDPRPISELVAVGDIYPGEQIIRNKFAVSGTTSALAIPTGKIAMSVRLGDPERVAGFLRPGSNVVIFLSGTVKFEGPNARPDEEITTLLLPKITVLAVGPTTLKAAPAAQANKESLPTAILTLATTQEEAEKIIHAQRKGDLYFGLLNEDSVITRRRVLTDADLLE
ncbi:MAG TPA: Flp pilus assembly protein CpaB [Frankiaceae bacterium]|nr:Flp pilus assembly protein CpaB [Frankiaceae bacterium]